MFKIENSLCFGKRESAKNVEKKNDMPGCLTVFGKIFNQFIIIKLMYRSCPGPFVET